MAFQIVASGREGKHMHHTHTIHTHTLSGGALFFYRSFISVRR